MKLSSDERQFGRIMDFVRDIFLIIRAFKIAVQLLYFIHIPNLYSINFSRQFFCGQTVDFTNLEEGCPAGCKFS